MRVRYVLREPSTGLLQLAFECGHKTTLAPGRRERPAAGQHWPCPHCTKREDAILPDPSRYFDAPETARDHDGVFRAIKVAS